MRHHALYPVFDLWTDARRLRRIVSAETLAAARVEPMMRQASGFGVADLTFARDGEIAVVPFVAIEASMLAEPERGPFVWPRAAAASLDDEVADAIEARLLPWLLAHFLGRRLNAEIVERFGADDGAFDRARAYGFLGAASYAAVAEAAAPYLYAARFAAGRRVAVVDRPSGATGAAILARAAAELAATFGSPEADAFARRWFDGRFASERRGAYDLAVGPAGADLPESAVRVTLGEDGPEAVPVARAIPTDVLFSFDPEDSEPAAHFAVSAPEPALRRSLGGHVPAAVGGSTGRLLFALRNDGLRAADADTDDALALAGRLRAEGFEVAVRPAAEVRDLAGYDLVHCFTFAAVADLGDLPARARAAGLPVVATPHLEDLAREGVWGAGISAGVRTVVTDDDLEAQLEMIERRALEAENLNPRGQEPYAGYGEAVRRALSSCDAVLVSGAAEERYLRETLGWNGDVAPVGPALFPTDEVPFGGAPLYGDAPFVLAHAPIAARANLLTLAGAAMRAGLPLVVAGPVVETGYLALLREMADERVAVVTTASPEAIRRLYRRARVFADVGWEDRGTARQAAAVLAGAALLVSSSHHAAQLWRPGLWTADRASVAGVAEGLRAAWEGAGTPVAMECAGRVAVYADPVASLTGVVAAYARAQAARAPA